MTIVTEDGPLPPQEPLSVPDGGVISERVTYKCAKCGHRSGRIDEWNTAEGERVVCFFGHWYRKDAEGRTSALTRVALLQPESRATVAAECPEHGALRLDRARARAHVLDSYSVQAAPDRKRKVTRRIKLDPVD